MLPGHGARAESATRADPDPRIERFPGDIAAIRVGKRHRGGGVS
jgi:hypothetical protein